MEMERKGEHANLFLHYVFDDFMVKEFPSIPWARYADDGIAHCVSLKQAKYLKRRLQEQFATYGLELNLEKIRIVYCKDDDRKGKHEYTSFDFLGYTFRPRLAKNLIKLGVNKHLAWSMAYYGAHIARVCHGGALHNAITKERLTQFGLVSMLDFYTERCVTC